MAFSIDRGGFIPTSQGELGLIDTLSRSPELRLVCPDPLVESAILRLLRAVVYASGAAPETVDEYHEIVSDPLGSNVWSCAKDWLHENKDNFDLLSTDTPFYQDSKCREIIAEDPGAAINPLYLDLSSAWDRPLLSDHRHRLVPAKLTLPQAARMLVTQQMWALPGRISASEKNYGKGCNFGTQPIHTGGVAFVPDGPTLAHCLAWSLIPSRGDNSPHWTWEPRSDTSPGGTTDSLTWMNRRVLLDVDEDMLVSRIAFAQGWPRTLLEDSPVWANVGAEDIAMARSGKRLQASYAVYDADDPVECVAAWWRSGEGSLPEYIRRAAGVVDSPLGVRAVGLAIDQKMIKYQLDIPLYRRSLTDPHVAEAVTAVQSCRYDRKKQRKPFVGIGSSVFRSGDFSLEDVVPQLVQDFPERTRRVPVSRATESESPSTEESKRLWGVR